MKANGSRLKKQSVINIEITLLERVVTNSVSDSNQILKLSVTDSESLFYFRISVTFPDIRM